MLCLKCQVSLFTDPPREAYPIARFSHEAHVTQHKHACWKLAMRTTSRDRRSSGSPWRGGFRTSGRGAEPPGQVWRHDSGKRSIIVSQRDKAKHAEEKTHKLAERMTAEDGGMQAEFTKKSRRRWELNGYKSCSAVVNNGATEE